MLPLIICLISGIGLSLAFPRADLHGIAWIALAPLMYYAVRLTWRGALLCSFAFGFAYFASLLYWIGVFGKLPWAALAAFQGLYIVGFALTAKLVGGRLGPWGRFTLLPTLWVPFEWLRSVGALGFTWGDVGYSQYKVLPIAQLASVTGIWGISFLIAVPNAALANLLLARGGRRGYKTAHGQIALAVATVLAVGVFGLAEMKASVGDSDPPVPVAVIQGNIPQTFDRGAGYEARVWDTYRAMTLSAAERGPRLIVWPETVVPGLVGSDPHIQRRLMDVTGQARASLLVGGWDENGKGGEFNGVFLVEPGHGIRGRYAKVHLVPFGEYLPGWARRSMPFLQEYKVTTRNLTPGPGYDLMDAGWGRLGTAICFESIFPDITRRLTKSGAQVLCVVTNDSWFEDTTSAQQHTAMSAIRAIENRRYLIHSATTGVSGVFDPWGRMIARGELLRRTTLHAEIRPRSVATFYTRHGDWLVYICLVTISLLAVVACARKPAKETQ